MTGPDSLVVIASYLRPEEAGMLRGLLESAGIVAVLRDEMLSSVHPFLQPIIGGVKLVVRTADAERAREVVRFAGVLPASPQDEPVDIPEEEWSAVSENDVEMAEVPSTATWSRRVLKPVLFLCAPLLALWRCGVGV